MLRTEGYIELVVLVDLGVIRRNLRSIKTLTGGKLLFMVKANAYGHGIVEVARATSDIVDMFGVATVNEGIALRRAGLRKDILVAVCSIEEIELACKYALTIGLSDVQQLAGLCEFVRNGVFRAQDIKLHLKLDTGMHRLGFEPYDIDRVLNTLEQHKLDIEGVYSHLRDTDYNQIASFEQMSARVQEVYPNAMRHLASSHSLCEERLHYDMVRVGLYGYSRAMSVVSQVLKVRQVCAGEHVSYGNYVVQHDTNIAIVFGGYADGVCRKPPSEVSIRGKRCRAVGNICMDMFAVDCGSFEPQVGETVILQGADMPILEIAQQRDTIEYTALTAWGGRAQRIYFNDKNTSKSSCKS